MKFKLKFRDLKVEKQEAVRDRVMVKLAGGKPLNALEMRHLLEVFNQADIILISNKFSLTGEVKI